MSLRFFYPIILCCVSFYSLGNVETNNTVDHKDSQLNLYLDLIRYNTQEKLGILPYILQAGGGNFLEVGTGGDPVVDLLEQIPESMSPLIIASDVDDNILKLLPARHPRLNKYLQYGKKGPQLKLQQLDATNLTCFKDNYLDGINASAVVHEIMSYAGGLNGVDQFFAESYRTLKPGGVLVYRDPEAVNDQCELVDVELSTRPIRLFAHMFLPKFLDTVCGKMAKLKRKIKYYLEQNIEFIVYKKNESTQSHLTYDAYLKIRSSDIDFSRKYIVKMPRGLCRELERHYLTYLHQCNPLVFVKCLPNVGSDDYCVNFLAHSTRRIFEEFLHANAIKKSQEGTISVPAKIQLDGTILENMRPLEYGIAFKFASNQKKAIVWNLLNKHHFEPLLYITYINDTTWLIDYRVFGLLYDYIVDIINEESGPVNKLEIVHAQWLKREGEEKYIYYSDDELITRVAELTYNIETDYVLCPLSVESNFFVPRLCYEEVLKGSLTVYDHQGYPIEIKEGKRIVHFRKMIMENALPIYHGIIAQNPQGYVKLKGFIEQYEHKHLSKDNHEQH